MTAVNTRVDFEQAIDSFKRADAECKLSVLWHIYQELGNESSSPAPAAMYSQVVNHLIGHLQQVSREERADALKDIINGAETRFGREYSDLNINMRLAFWYRLAKGLDPALVGANKNCQDNSKLGQEIIRFLGDMDLNQQMHFLRQALSL
ncbi:MAG TPA: orange carotenoid protein N-terminal domain-containing protein [Leptolyngbyaceae cyanobacterium]